MLDLSPIARCCTHKFVPSPRCTTEPPGSSHQSPPHYYLGEVDGVGQSEVARAKIFKETESNPAPGSTRGACFQSQSNILDPVKQHNEMLDSIAT